MSNMSYCMFRNTLIDLIGCQDALDVGTLAKLSGDELKAARRLIKLCRQIADDYEQELP